MHDEFIQTMLYQRKPNMHPTYGFRILGRSTQAWLKSGLELCFDADRLCSRLTKTYQGHNTEAHATTAWQRDTAKTFSRDDWWQQQLQGNARDIVAKVDIEQLHQKYQKHKLFTHHTLGSLLYVAKTLLPPLQQHLRRARRVFVRWSLLNTTGK